jgi:hypothetical protein
MIIIPFPIMVVVFILGAGQMQQHSIYITISSGIIPQGEMVMIYMVMMIQIVITQER